MSGPTHVHLLLFSVWLNGATVYSYHQIPRFHVSEFRSASLLSMALMRHIHVLLVCCEGDKLPSQILFEFIVLSWMEKYPYGLRVWSGNVQRIRQITARCHELCLVLCRVWVCHSLFCRYTLFIKFYCMAYIVIWAWNKLWGLHAFSCWWRFLCKFRQVLWISNTLKVESSGKWHFCCAISFQLFGAAVILINVENYRPYDTVPHSTRLESFAILMWEPKVSQIRLCHHNLCHSERVLGTEE